MHDTIVGSVSTKAELMTSAYLMLIAACTAATLPPGTHYRRIEVDGQTRSYYVHVPRGIDAEQPLPVVLVLHGGGMNARWAMSFTGLNTTANAQKFIAVYPNGTGFWFFLNWNAGGVLGPRGEGLPDDVKFLSAVLDDVALHAPVDQDRLFATGFSNGGMMCYRLAAELSDRIAAIAPVAGTMTLPDPQPVRPVPIIHFHGTKDGWVPPGGPAPGTPDFLTFFSLPDTLRAWCEVNGCDFETPIETQLPDIANDGTTVRRAVYGPGTNGAEIISLTIENGGHTWPGRWSLLGPLVGKTTRDISANELIWEFFNRHPLP